MHIHRSQLKYLHDWALQPKHKPLIIRGARQVGKSTVVAMLAEKLDFNLCTVDFEKKPQYCELFNSNEPQTIIELLSIQLKQDIIPGRTILFLDEIQATPQVISCLRYFYESLPELHVLAAGSLLEFALQDMHYSIPVGRIEYMYMGPLSFEEFLLAVDEKQAVDFLHNFRFEQTIPTVLHEKFLKLLANYYIVGGMPEVVASYVEYKNLSLVERIKNAIVDTFQNDFSKYSKGDDLFILQKTFNKIPLQIGNKFQYVNIDNTIKPQKISQALDKLCLAKIATKVFHTSANGIPLGAEQNDKRFKVIYLDIGLVNTILGLNLLDLMQAESLMLVNQGALAEQLIGQQLLDLRPLYETPRLFYWSRDKKGSEAELDYIVNLQQHIIPVEVKSGKSGTLKSLHTFLHEKDLHIAVRVNTNLPLITQDAITMSTGVKLQYKLISLPLYLVGQMYRLIEV